MRKLVYFVLAFAAAAALAAVFKDSWDTAAFVKTQGRESSLKIGRKYNSSVWSSPIPLKKIHTYEAVLADKYEVLVESDQTFAEREEVFIRFVTRDLAAQLRDQATRPIVGAIRLRTDADGRPVRIADTDLFDKMVDRAMADPGQPISRPTPRTAEAAPDRAQPTVPYLIGGVADSPLELVWKNSTPAEITLFALALLFTKALFINALTTPFRSGERKGFVHPALRSNQPPPPVAAQAPKVTYTAKPEQEIALTETEKRERATPRATIALPVRTPPAAPPPSPVPEAAPATTPPAAETVTQAPPPAEEPPSLLANETAPPMPISDGPTLSLRRKKPTTPPPPPAS